MADEQAAAPVVVTPIPASKSRILWLANITATLGGALTLLPELASDPIVVDYMQTVMSDEARRTFGVAMFVLGFYLRHLRKDTNAPIIGTPAADPDSPRNNKPAEGGG